MFLLAHPKIEKVWVNEYLKEMSRFKGSRIAEKFNGRLLYWDESINPTERDEKPELVVTLGGDGTVLYASHLFQGHVPPILPFNLGSLGFLTVFDYGRCTKHLENVLDGTGDVNICIRMRMKCTVRRMRRSSHVNDKIITKTAISMEEEEEEADGDWERTDSSNPDDSDDSLPSDRHSCFVSYMDSSTFSDQDLPHSHMKVGEEWQVLNEVVVDRGAGGSMCQVQVFVGNTRLTTILADGLVVGTLSY